MVIITHLVSYSRVAGTEVDVDMLAMEEVLQFDTTHCGRLLAGCMKVGRGLVLGLICFKHLVYDDARYRKNKIELGKTYWDCVA